MGRTYGVGLVRIAWHRRQYVGIDHVYNMHPIIVMSTLKEICMDDAKIIYVKIHAVMAMNIKELRLLDS